MIEEAQPLAPDAEHVGVPAHALVAPVVERLVVLLRTDEVLHLHQLELADAEDVVAGRDLVSESLALLRDAEGHADAGGVDDVLEVDEHALRGLRPEVDLRRAVLDRAHVGLEHEVEHARVVESAAALRALLAEDVVGAPALLALAEALAQRVDEIREVARGFPHGLR